MGLTNNGSLNHERRQHKRCQVDLPTSVCYLGDYLHDKIVEISEGGGLLRSNQDYPKGTVLELCFLLSNSSSVITQAEILYHLKDANDQIYYGMRFIDLAEDFLLSIRQFIEQKK